MWLGDNMLIKCVFSDDLIKKPLIYELNTKFAVITNIEKADITFASGWVTFRITGEEQEIKNSIDWLEQTGIKVEVLERGD